MYGWIVTESSFQFYMFLIGIVSTWVHVAAQATQPIPPAKLASMYVMWPTAFAQGAYATHI